MFYIGAQLAEYRDRHGNYPPACVLDPYGRPAHSWRALLYADIDSDFRRAYNFNEPWDSPGNILLAREPPRMFCCPTNENNQEQFASYLALIDGAMFRDRVHQKRRDEAASDRLIFLVEVPPSHIRWTDPRDICLDDLRSIAPGAHPRGVAVLFGDRRVRRVSLEELTNLANNQRSDP